MERPSRLDDFPNLESDLHRHRVDALLYPTLLDIEEIRRLKDQDIPVCGVFAREPDLCGVGIEQQGMITQAVEELCKKGCRHIAVTAHHHLLNQWHKPLRRAFALAAAPLASAGGKAEFIIAPDAATRRAGRCLGRFLLQRPADQRPDGIFVLSDVIAIGLSETLAAAGYRPQLIVQTNRQIPLAFALPATCYEVDVAELARIGVEMIARRMRDPSVPDETKRVVPHRIEPFSAGDGPDESSIEKVQVLDHQFLLS